LSRVLTSEEFESIISGTQKTVVLDFYADWCGPCKMQSPIFEEAGEEAKEIADFYKINVDQSQALAIKFGVMSIPTIIVIKNGEVAFKNVGLTSKEKILENIS
jgi:thioredoxin 1